MRGGEALPMGLSVAEAQEWVERGGLEVLMSAAFAARESIGRCVTVDANVLLVVAGSAVVQRERARDQGRQTRQPLAV